jgi:uncharacterized membrane protein
MNPADYLLAPSSFGALEWAFFIGQIAVLLAGAYFALLRSDPKPVRGPALRRMGLAMLALGAVGTLVGALHLANVLQLSWPIWKTVVTLFELVLAIYVVMYAQTRYPQELAAATPLTNRGKGGGRLAASAPRSVATAPANGHAVSDAAARSGGSGRRAARREHKRRKK